MLLVAVLLLFLFTEFPQGILGLLSGISSKCFFVMCYGQFGELMDLLALINAAIGFVLYGLMSKQFRTSFKMLFLKQRESRMEMTRVTGVQSTCVWPQKLSRLAEKTVWKSSEDVPLKSCVFSVLSLEKLYLFFKFYIQAFYKSLFENYYVRNKL